ncbi:prolyl oligopeptidase family serine peptidase [Reichenbachiella sp. 5M10]|uniref:carboxylesterase family protein n=1 Tax=Reichenbachiella sp. 5M10 TaxID=1889772 RepID=UPI0013046E9B|nr:prolyl oligopeptidase family serine peptidase [Reichenbachiella sp. 5M10]
MRRFPIYLILILALPQCQTKSQKQDSTLTIAAQLTTAQNQAWVNEHLDQVMQASVFVAKNGHQMPYRIFIPDDYRPDESLPLLIHLHGRGERGTDNNPKIYNNIPLFNGPRSIVSPNMQQRYRSIVLVPQCSDTTINEEWAKWVGNTPETPFEGLGEDGSYLMNDTPSSSGAAALELIDYTIDRYHIDKSRVYLTGLSMGGFGTWEFIGRRPELFAAAVPMAGYSDPRTVDRIQSIPIWVFHSNIDQYNPVAGSRHMYQLLTEAGAEVLYTEYDSTTHGDTFQRAWQNEELIPWIYSQQQ